MITVPDAEDELLEGAELLVATEELELAGALDELELITKGALEELELDELLITLDELLTTLDELLTTLEELLTTLDELLVTAAELVEGVLFEPPPPPPQAETNRPTEIKEMRLILNMMTPIIVMVKRTIMTSNYITSN